MNLLFILIVPDYALEILEVLGFHGSALHFCCGNLVRHIAFSCYHERRLRYFNESCCQIFSLVLPASLTTSSRYHDRVYHQISLYHQLSRINLEYGTSNHKSKRLPFRVYPVSNRVQKYQQHSCHKASLQSRHSKLKVQIPVC